MTTTEETPPRVPDAAWLEARFGAGSLWRPAEADLPAELTDQESREFLTTVGFPAVTIDAIRFDSTHLRDAERRHTFDADELYGRRYPDDHSPPESFCFCFGLRYEDMLMLAGALGDIDLYDPNGWDHGRGYKGTVASSLPSLAVLLGLLAERAEAIEAIEDDEEARAEAVGELRARMTAFDAYVEDAPFWDEVFEYLAE
ncbi:SUKH-4 family immunity protein [Streptomyces sp. RTd22]|uniref:SUKH-4 family immunity protein n=1 Tax=Streptomyces sp. RTd22 TaxID=1841249 RepID=UPI0007C59159|nr:SUKH-4 family immunity protein [Streptomyces sp. RTd22]